MGTLNRRQVMSGALAAGAAILAPAHAAATPGPEFAAMRRHLDETLAVLRAARDGRAEAQERILADMRASRSRARAFFNAPEIRAVTQARMRARGAAENIFFSRASLVR